MSRLEYLLTKGPKRWNLKQIFIDEYIQLNGSNPSDEQIYNHLIENKLELEKESIIWKDWWCGTNMLDIECLLEVIDLEIRKLK